MSIPAASEAVYVLKKECCIDAESIYGKVVSRFIGL